MNIKSLATVAILATLSLTVVDRVSATIITDVTASTDMGQFQSFDIQNGVNGHGLIEDESNLTKKKASNKLGSNRDPLGKHAPSNTSNAWISNRVQSTGMIEFNLHGVYNLTGFDFWNASGELAPNGIQTVTISTSIDGVEYTVLEDGPTRFAQGDRSKRAQLPQSFTVKAVQAQYVRFQVRTNYTGNVLSETGFSEIRFRDTAMAAVSAGDSSPRDLNTVTADTSTAGISNVSRAFPLVGAIAAIASIAPPARSTGNQPIVSGPFSPLTAPPATGAPTPALLPGLIGMGLATLRKRRHNADRSKSDHI